MEFTKKELPEFDEKLFKAQQFINEIDKPGAIISVFDEGKVFARYCALGYQYLYSKIFDFVFHNTKYVRIRVGGYSYRAASMAQRRIEKLSKDRIYVDYLSLGKSNEIERITDSRVNMIYMGDYQFTEDMAIVKEAEEYDFKSFGDKSGMHPMVYYYVNNIDTGFYDENGEFHRFYNKNRGLQAISDVVMIKGYKDIPPATAVISTFTFDKEGDIIIAGGSMHRDRRSRTTSQRMLIKSAGIKCIDLTTKV